MPTLSDGERLTVQGSGSSRYTLARAGDVHSCTCPAWQKQSAPPARRTCKHLRAHLGDAAETARVGAARPKLKMPARPKHVSIRPEDPERRAERRAALARALDRFPAARAKMQRIHGLRMPRHLACSMGFWLGLDRDERKEAWAYLGTGPGGVGEWLLDGGLDLVPRDGLDERLQDRYRRDPPELVTVFGGNSDGGHWGLWYDDPAELPALIAQNYARDSAETWPCAPTLLTSLHASIAGSSDDPWDPREWPLRATILGWFEEVMALEIDAHHAEAIAAPPPRSTWLVGGMDPVVPASALPDDLSGYAAQEARLAAYRANGPEVAAWIARAEEEIARGAPGRALFLGRELHWFDDDAFRDPSTRLLVRAYEALGRAALARIVEIHHAHRDLPSVEIYARHAGGPLTAAIAAKEMDRADAILAQRTFTEPDLRDALRIPDPAAIERLLSHAGAHLADDAADEHVAEAIQSRRYAEAHPSLGDHADRHRAAATCIFERLGARGRPFARALASGDPPLRDAALAHADLAWRSLRGRTVLHLAARALDVDAARTLIDRGADPRARDADGKIPYDAARAAWQERPGAAGPMFELLTQRGGGPDAPPAPAPARAPGWRPGVAVTHAKFGAGVVEAAEGAGDDAKLTIRFGGATKVLLARFVKAHGEP